MTTTDVMLAVLMAMVTAALATTLLVGLQVLRAIRSVAERLDAAERRREPWQD